MKNNSWILLTSAAILLALSTACATHVGYRAYDRGNSDYHVWGPPEVTYYGQWETETHRPHRDFRRRQRDQQDAYWKWRHDHPDHR